MKKDTTIDLTTDVPKPYTLIPTERWTNYDDVPVGFRFGSTGKTITEADVYFGSGAVGGPVHVDLEYIKANTQFEERLLPGPLILYYGICLISSTGIYTSLVVSFGSLDKVRAHKPVYHGDTIRAYATVQSKRVTSKPGLGVVIYDVEVYNQKDNCVMSFEYTLMVRVEAKEAA